MVAAVGAPAVAADPLGDGSGRRVGDALAKRRTPARPYPYSASTPRAGAQPGWGLLDAQAHV
eukprot:4627040-Lingulodinium_polyedra.AAC.1